jgi:hypothetical protein
MTQSDYHHLLFRRQYLISPITIECPFVSDTIEINHGYKLHYHKDLVVTKVSNQTRSLILLGDLYDFQDQKANNTEILNKLLAHDFFSLVEKTFGLAGRFVLVYSDQDGIKLFSDAVAQRKIFHTTKDDGMYCASNPHLLARVLGMKKTKNTCLLEYYQSPEFENNFNSNIGYFTLYDEIKQVLPNHFLDLSNHKVSRYWPFQRNEKMDDKEIVHICAQMIKGFISSAANRYPLMIPVTSGGDSRIILAATRDLSSNIYYYINSSKEIENKPDLWVPQKILKKFDRKFNILFPDEQQIDDEFRKAYYENNPVPHDFYLPIIYNYYINHPEKVNTPGGVIPIIKGLYSSDKKDITALELTRLYKVDRFPCSLVFYKDWLDGFNNDCRNSNINLFDLLYWEDRTCNWAGQIMQDKDIAQEEFVPFNSHQLIVTMLNYTRSKRKKPRYELHHEIIRELWPELLEIPFNPSLKNTIIRKLIDFGIYEPIYQLRKFIISITKFITFK